MTGLTVAAVVIPLTTVVSHSFGRTAYPLLLPAIKDDLGLSNASAGLASTTIHIAYLFGVLLVTFAAGRLEPMTILKTGLAISFGGLLLLSAAASFELLLAGLVLASAGGAGIWITAPLLATSGVSRAKRGMVIGLLTGSIGLSNSIIALGTRAARSSSGNETLWRPIYLGMAIASLVITLLVITLVRSEPSEARPQSGFGLAGLRSMPGWLPITLGYVAFGAIASGYASFLAEALEENGGLTRERVALVYVGLGFGSMIGAPLIGWISDRTSRKAALIGVMFIMLTTSLTVALGSGVLLYGTVVCFGGLWASYPTLTATYIRDHLDDRQFGQAYGTMTIFYGLAAVLPPAVSGSIADQTGSFTVPYLLIAGLAVLGIGILSQVPAPSRDLAS